jgi:uncharacterized membrane protein
MSGTTTPRALAAGSRPDSSAGLVAIAGAANWVETWHRSAASAAFNRHGGNRMPSQNQYSTRKALLDVLIEKIETDRYPSTTMLNLIEELLTPEDVPEYAEVLLSRVREDQFPSIPMLNRIHRLA